MPSKRIPRLMTLALGCFAAATLLLAACDDGGDEEATTEAPVTTTTPADTPTDAATEAATEAATPTEAATATEAATPTEAAAGAAEFEDTVNVSEEGDLAPFLVGPDGMTLYLFTNDEPGVSNCADTCAENWPPLTVEAGEEPSAGEGADGTLAVIERDDGGMQVTYNDLPLYYFARDEAPGDTTGHEVNDVWFAVTPEGAAVGNGGGGEATATGTP